MKSCQPTLRSATAFVTRFIRILKGRRLALSATAFAASIAITPVHAQNFDPQATGSSAQSVGVVLPPTLPTSTPAASAGSRVDALGPAQLTDLPREQGAPQTGWPRNEARPAYSPGEFEVFVNNIAARSSGHDSAGHSAMSLNGPGALETSPPRMAIQRFGADLITASPGTAQDFSPQVPRDYLITPGDEIVLSIWGSVNANLRLTVDRNGQIAIPRVGTVMVAGVPYADLANVVRQQVAQVFRNFQLNASLGRLRGIRIYVTGFALQPGSYTVSSLSTIVNALMQTGGPSAAGSFRDIQLRRGGKLIARFDLYDLLLKGDTSFDRVLQAEDVLQIGPVGPQVAIIGSINRPAIFELKPEDTVSDVIAMAAGFNPVADRTRLGVEHLGDPSGLKIAEVHLPAGAGQRPHDGDVFRAFSLAEPKQPLQQQNKHVRVEGEVTRPGDYILPPGSTLEDAIKTAGGMVPGAYVYGTEFDRESVRKTQQENYDKALRDMEADFSRRSAAISATSAEELNAQRASSLNAGRLVEKLRAVKPTGRIVLQLSSSSPSLPDLPLEDGDRIYIPARPTTVGVFGSVFSGGSYLYGADRSIGDYLRLAGGPTRDADNRSIFVIRANGTVVSSRQSGGWFGLGSELSDVPALPGDTIFVPSEFDTTTFVQGAKDWTQILYQFGLGIAGIKSAVK